MRITPKIKNLCPVAQRAGRSEGMSDEICEIKGGETGGYFLRISDGHCENTWAVTGDELRTLRDVLNKKFPLADGKE